MESIILLGFLTIQCRWPDTYFILGRKYGPSVTGHPQKRRNRALKIEEWAWVFSLHHPPYTTHSLFHPQFLFLKMKIMFISTSENGKKKKKLECPMSRRFREIICALQQLMWSLGSTVWECRKKKALKCAVLGNYPKNITEDMCRDLTIRTFTSTLFIKVKNLS